MENYDFSGWATRNNLRCSDGRTIMKDAFKHNDGQKVPLVWNHKHEDPTDVLGHAILENRDEGVYAYCSFNDTENGELAKVLVKHGDIDKLSIYANQLKQQGGNVIHGMIREVSLVHAGANPGAFIENVIAHSDDGESRVIEDECRIFTGETFELYHADNSNDKEEKESMAETEQKEKTIQDVFDELTEEQQNAVYAVIGMALDEDPEDDEDDEDNEGDEEMKQNVFNYDETNPETVLTHADQKAIIASAKQVGSFKTAFQMYKEQHNIDDTLAHGFETEHLKELLPEYTNLNPGAPEILRADQSWVMGVINDVHKSPHSRVRTRQADARAADLRAKGYNNREEEKKLQGQIKLLQRTTDPQTIYVKDKMHRDDILDIEDFDLVAYNWNLMKANMYETLALATLIGDGRDELDEDKIKEEHFRSIWHDEELYTIHRTVDIEAARKDIQGTNTDAYFSENYIYAEAIIRDTLYAREKFKGSGRPKFYCDPHLVNVMLLSRDMNGRRIYDSKDELAKALNVAAIVEVEQFAGKTRVDEEDGKTRKLLGIFVNLADYQYGSAKGGEITKFDDFDIDYNTYKYLMETRLSGALTKPFAAIALEELVATEAAG